MAVEIRELVIKTTVDNSAGGGASSAGKSGTDEASVISKCVEQVMELLKHQNER